MNCGRRSAVDDVRSRRTRAVDEDRRRIRWVVDEDRHRKRWTVDDDRRRRKMAVDDDRRHEPLWVAQVLQSLDRMDDLCVKFMHSVERTMSRSATIPASSLLYSPNTHEQPTQLQRDPSVADFDFMEENQFTMSRPYPPSPPTQTEPHLIAAAPSPPAAADQDPANQTPAATTAADLEMPTAAGDQASATPAADSPTRRERDLSPDPKSSHASVQATLQIPSPALASAAQRSSPASEHSNTARLDLPATGTPAGELPTSVDILQSEPQLENLQRDSGKEPENSVDILPGDSTCLFRSQPLAASRRDASLSDREADAVLPAPYTSDSTLKTDDLSPARKNQAYRPPACPQVCVAPSLVATDQVVEKTSYGTVYKAKLANGGNIALRLLREGTCKDLASSSPVIHQLGRARHENLVPLRAFYHGKRGEKLLIYDYITATSTSSPPQTSSLPPPWYSSSANYKNILTHLKFYENGGKSWLDPPLICV